jgi:hypothetical protein
MKTQHSAYWLDEQYFETGKNDINGTETSRSEEIATLVRLAAARRAVTNFVRILTGKDIPVVFSSGKTSYTDGEKIVISADTSMNQFDSIVGLALHEASHVLLSDFKMLEVFRTFTRWADYQADLPMRAQSRNVWKEVLHPYIAGKVSDSEPNAAKLYDQLHNLMNMLEDRRIDKYVYQTAPGYRPYYDALYERYFYKSELISNFRNNPEWRRPTFENYLNHLLLHFVPGVNRKALPGLSELIRLIDLPTIERVAPTTAEALYMNELSKWVPGSKVLKIEYARLPALWRAANELMAVIMRYVDIANQVLVPSDTSTNDAEPTTPSSNGSANENGLGSLPNLDYPTMDDFEKHDPAESIKKPSTPRSAERAAKQLADVVDVLNHEVRRKKLSVTDAGKVDAMERAEGDIETVTVDGLNSSVEVLTLRRVTPEILGESWFPFGGTANYYSRGTPSSVAAEGRSMGARLVQQLQLRNDERTTTWRRQPSGRIDRRLLASLGVNETNVFSRTQTDVYRPALLHLSLDASASMDGEPWRAVVTVATALAYVGKNMRGIDVVISLRGGADMPVVAVLFDSRRDSLASFNRLMASVRPCGNTPEGLAFKAIEDLILKEVSRYDTYFINFSDGEPWWTLPKTKKNIDAYGFSRRGNQYASDVARKHTREAVEKMRRHGVKILSYFIGSVGTIPNWANQNIVTNFRSMYGEDARFVNVTNVHQVLNTLNERLL